MTAAVRYFSAAANPSPSLNVDHLGDKGSLDLHRTSDRVAKRAVCGHGLLSFPRKIARATARTGIAGSDAAAGGGLLDRQLMVALSADRVAVELDLPDLVDFMLGTGVRIGEALAVRPTVIDLEKHELEINATLIREKGMGLAIQENPKTRAGWRVIAMPDYVVSLIQRRLDKSTVRSAGVVFPSPMGHLRDPSNTTADLRRALDRANFEWVTSHTFRKSAATWMDEAGMSARQIADHLGHAQPSVTQDVYMGRAVASTKAAHALQIARVS